MKKITLFICLFLITLSYAQENVSGYYITASGQRTEGYFKDTYFQDETTLRFSATSGGKFEKLEPSMIQEYGIGQDYRFVKHTVQVDKAGIDGDQIGLNKEPSFETMTIFLNVLAEGDASLYSYTSNGVVKYFYDVKSRQVPVKQLVYRKYKATATATAENNRFRQQLYADLQCASADELNKYLNISYSKKDIIPLIKLYNDCKKFSTKTYRNDSGKPAKLYYNVYAGVYNATYNIEGLTNPIEADNSIGFTGGIELSYVFPSQKLGLFFRGEYETLSATSSVDVGSRFGPTVTTYSYNSDLKNINLFLGPRYFIPLGERSKLSIDASLMASFVKGFVTQDTSIDYNDGSEVLTSRTLQLPFEDAIALSVGAGYIFNNKFTAELRLDTNRNYFGDTNLSIKTKHSRFGLFFKYTIN